MATKTTTKKTAATSAPVVNAEFNKVLEHIRKAAGWSIIGTAPNFAGLSSIGTTVMLNAKGQVEVSNLSNNLKKIASKEADAKTIARLVTEVNTAAIKASQAKPAPTAETTKTTKENKTMAPKKDDTKKAPEKKAAEVVPEVKPEKVIGKPVVNPAGESTPTFDSLKKVAETDEKTKEKLKGMWETFGVKYDFKVGNLTKALLAEGLWPASKDKDGDFKAGDDGLQVPVGYQKVYKEEKEQGIKGIGHLVNVAAASFGRHNMEKAEKEQTQAKGAKGVESTPDEKTLAKRLLQIEKLAINIDVEDLKNFLETSKAFAPALAMIKEQDAALSAL